jgi:benzoate membrane transport protein
MLAGVLLRFGLDAFLALQTQFGLVLAMFAAYLLARRWLPRYAIILTLLVGVALAAGRGLLRTEALDWRLVKPVFVMPEFSFAAAIGIALPLFIVTMASQNVPGVAATRASGYATPISPVVGWIGVTNLLFAPFGAFALNLAAITAAISMGRDAHDDPSRRYVAAIAAGVFYLLVGLSGATVVALFAAFPQELIVAIAGIALLATISGSLAAALREEAGREPAIVTFLVTASGVSIAGIGSAMWGIVAGTLTMLVLARSR